MLLRAPVQAVKSGQITRRAAHLVVVMRFYPRFLAKGLVDEYVRDLAPDGELFAEFKVRDRETGDHNQAFDDVRYEERFRLSDAGEAALERLARLAATRDVYLICQCGFDQRCHADLLLLTAFARHAAMIGQRPFAYPRYEARLEG